MGFPCGSAGKESTGNEGDLGLIPGWEDPLEKEMATHSSTFAWKIPWMEEPGGPVHGVAKSRTQLSNFSLSQPVLLKEGFNDQTEEIFMCSGPLGICRCGFPIRSGKSHVQL